MTSPEQVSSDPTRDLEADALEAAIAAIHVAADDADDAKTLAEAAIRAYLAARSAPEAGKAVVKPLVWESEPPYSVARPFAGLHYATEVVWPKNGKAFDYVMLSGPTVGAKRFASLSDAKAAAQADFEQRILSALASIPAPSGAEPVAWMDPDHVKKYGICWANGRQTEKYTVPLYTRPTPAPGPGDETYYTKGKDAPWFEALDDKAFAWEATTLAMHLNDTGLGDELDKWFPFQAVISDAADRIERLLAAAPQAIPAEDIAGLVKKLNAATMRTDWNNLPDDACIPAVPLLREAAAAITLLAACLRRERECYEHSEAEASDLRAIISECAKALGNGAHIDPTCSVEFMRNLPEEIRLVMADLRRKLEEAERDRDQLLLALDRYPAGARELHAALTYDRHRAEAAERKLEEARKALEPFATENDVPPNLPDDTRLTITFEGQQVAHATFGDFRRARALAASPSAQTDGGGDGH